MGDSQSDWTFAINTQADAAAREYRHRNNMYNYLVRRGLRLHVQAVDCYGNDVTDDGPPIEWLPYQTVRDVILEVADNIQRAQWGRIVVYQEGESIQEDVPLGLLADQDGTAQLTFACVSVIHDGKARAALSRAQVYADVGR